MRDRVGRFREANNGTLFLDEIGDMTPAMQAKILRVLQDRLITPIGSSTSQRVDVRIIAATHRDHFLRELAPENPKRLTPAAAEALLANSWPGNVRELRNLLQQATLTVRKSVIDRGDLPLGLASSPPPETIEALLLLPFGEATSRLEKLLFERALREAGGNRAEAARRLGIHRQFLYAKLKEHGLGDKPSSEI